MGDLARCYLDALDHTAATGDAARDKPWISNDYARRQRTGDLAAWHEMLLERLADTEAEDLLDQLVQHRALDGPEQDLLRARRAHQRGDTAAAGTLITAALRKLPGHQQMLGFAVSINAPLPTHAQRFSRNVPADRSAFDLDHPTATEVHDLVAVVVAPDCPAACE